MLAHKKRTLGLALILPFLLLVFLPTSIAQIDLNETELDARSIRKQAGFEKIFLTTGMLNQILGTGAGLRFYSGLTADKNVVLMAVAYDQNGSQMGSTFIQNDEGGNLLKIDQATKDAQVQSIVDHRRRLPIDASFAAETIQNLTSQPRVTGLHFMPAPVADDENSITLTAAAASSMSNTIEGIETMRSPCPPMCPGT